MNRMVIGMENVMISELLKNSVKWAWEDRFIGRDASDPIDQLKASSDFIYGMDPEPYAELKQTWRAQPNGRLSVADWARKILNVK